VLHEPTEQFSRGCTLPVSMVAQDKVLGEGRWVIVHVSILVRDKVGEEGGGYIACEYNSAG